MERLVHSLITALETHASRRLASRSSSPSSHSNSLINDTSHDPPAAEQRESVPPPPRRTLTGGTIPEPEPFKERIGRVPPYADAQTRWVTQQVWENYRPPQGPATTSSEPLAVLYQFFKNKKWLCIQSPPLIEAYKKVNKQPQLAKLMTSRVEPIVEVDPFPVLFYHLEDIRSEIYASGDEKVCISQAFFG